MSDIKKPLITTIIPTYRRPKLLQRAIKSVLNQTYPHFQVCVYDNASGDETASVVAELAKTDSRVKYHCHSENIGSFKNFNYGMEHVNTPFFSFLSDDDILLPEFYQTVMEGFEKYPDAMFSAGSCIHMTDKGKVNDVTSYFWQRYGYYTQPEGFLKIMENHIITWTSILFRRDVIEKVGVLDNNVGGASDLDLELRIAAHFPFVITKKACAIFVIHDSSYCGSATYQSFWPGWHNMIQGLIEDELIPMDVRKRAEYILTDNIRRWLYRFGITAIKQKNFTDAYEIANILNDQYHQKVKSIIIYFMVTLRRYFPPFYYSIFCLNKVLKFFKFGQNHTRKHLQEQFGCYGKMLELDF